MLTVWGRNNSINVQKVMWTVLHLSLPYERIDAGRPFGKTDTPEFQKMNPMRRVPVLQHGDLTLFESQAIVRYLAAAYDVGGLWPEDPAERALSDLWMDWASQDLQMPLVTLVRQLVRAAPGERDSAAIENASADAHALVGVLNERLASSPYIAGDRLTIGDIAVGAAVYRYMKMPIDRPIHRNVETYFSRLQESPAYREGVMVPLT